MKEKCVHYWKINEHNVGTCIYCGAVKDFGKLQKQKSWLYSENAKRGAEASIGVERKPYGSRIGKRATLKLGGESGKAQFRKDKTASPRG